MTGMAGCGRVTGCWASASWDPNSTVIGPLLGVAQLFRIKVWLEVYVAESVKDLNVYHFA